mmetsp:Transcript_2427/g.4064  ORF Transcript_2427/g.4064 Transcript_2427/m.4064 type:complete len:420 (-) Transcript_2427:87-1346(-)|eukprot:CAMPEP_0198205310 /NCGR_PEP_ID=MMETSP1445-20131203/8833_1 /TAXON_ID=36898 /ORGANISM="Pyramimonas sp., Strain CCMP2087" /LENGTH=419 /DNA_ID=CAMNT_0043877573 /DNA_START=98 /DNA_END=1357 /DNA_ORIENTATION=-
MSFGVEAGVPSPPSPPSPPESEEPPSWEKLLIELKDAKLEDHLTIVKSAAKARVQAGALARSLDHDLSYAIAFSHPRDERIQFKESSHEYFLDGKLLPISVTGLYMRYFEAFDARGAVDQYADRWRQNKYHKWNPLLAAMGVLGVPFERQKEAVLLGWKLNGATQSSIGTALHRTIELSLNGREDPELVEKGNKAAAVVDGGGQELQKLLEDPETYNLGENPEACRIVSTWILSLRPSDQPSAEEFRFPALSSTMRFDAKEFAYFAQWRADNGNLIAVRQEMNVWSEELQLAGQLDALFCDTADDMAYVLVDWKRCKDLREEGFRNKRGCGPFNQISDSNLGHYYVQVNMYAALLRRHYGIHVKRMLLVQLHPNFPSYREFEVPCLAAEVNRAFAERERNLKSDRVLDLASHVELLHLN